MAEPAKSTLSATRSRGLTNFAKIRQESAKTGRWNANETSLSPEQARGRMQRLNFANQQTRPRLQFSEQARYNADIRREEREKANKKLAEDALIKKDKRYAEEREYRRNRDEVSDSRWQKTFDQRAESDEAKAALKEIKAKQEAQAEQKKDFNTVAISGIETMKNFDDITAMEQNIAEWGDQVSADTLAKYKVKYEEVKDAEIERGNQLVLGVANGENTVTAARDYATKIAPFDKETSEALVAKVDAAEASLRMGIDDRDLVKKMDKFDPVDWFNRMRAFGWGVAQEMVFAGAEKSKRGAKVSPFEKGRSSSLTNQAQSRLKGALKDIAGDDSLTPAETMTLIQTGMDSMKKDFHGSAMEKYIGLYTKALGHSKMEKEGAQGLFKQFIGGLDTIRKITNQKLDPKEEAAAVSKALSKEIRDLAGITKYEAGKPPSATATGATAISMEGADAIAIKRIMDGDGTYEEKQAQVETYKQKMGQKTAPSTAPSDEELADATRKRDNAKPKASPPEATYNRSEKLTKDDVVSVADEMTAGEMSSKEFLKILQNSKTASYVTLHKSGLARWLNKRDRKVTKEDVAEFMMSKIK